MKQPLYQQDLYSVLPARGMGTFLRLSLTNLASCTTVVYQDRGEVQLPFKTHFPLGHNSAIANLVDLFQSKALHAPPKSLPGRWRPLILFSPLQFLMTSSEVLHRVL